MKKFWNWIKNSDDTRILRLEGPIDEESFWGDEITPQMFRDELESGEGDVTVWINSPGVMCSPLPRSIPCLRITRAASRSRSMRLQLRRHLLSQWPVILSR